MIQSASILPIDRYAGSRKKGVHKTLIIFKLDSWFSYDLDK